MKTKTVRVLRLARYSSGGNCEQPAGPCVEEMIDQNSLDEMIDQNNLDPPPCPEADEETTATYPKNGGDENSDAAIAAPQPLVHHKVKGADLLLKEIDEINDWSRLGCHLCFGFCTLFLAVNGVAIAWFTTSNRTFLFLVLILLNFAGALGTVLVGKYLLECDQRIRDVIWILSEHDRTDDPWSVPQSAIPRKAIKTLFGITASALITLLIFWTVVFVTAN